MWVKATKHDGRELWVNMDQTWLIAAAVDEQGNPGSIIYSGQANVIKNQSKPIFEIVKEQPLYFMNKPLPEPMEGTAWTSGKKIQKMSG